MRMLSVVGFEAEKSVRKVNLTKWGKKVIKKLISYL